MIALPSIRKPVAVTVLVTPHVEGELCLSLETPGKRGVTLGFDLHVIDPCTIRITERSHIDAVVGFAIAMHSIIIQAESIDFGWKYSNCVVQFRSGYLHTYGSSGDWLSVG